MYSGTVLLILSSIISVHALDFRIVGGHDAQRGKYPYQALIRRSNVFICGGSIISKRYILTAAHCIYKQKRLDYEVNVGHYSVYEWATVYRAEQLIWHPAYNDVTLINDIGLIYLKSNILFDSKVKPIGLATKFAIPANQPAVVTGWGSLVLNGKASEYLQEISLKIIPNDVCVVTWSTLKSTQICTLTKVSEGVCHGDSGGPLVVDSEQVGIVSYGNPCANGLPDVYTRVYSYKSWIEEYTNPKGSSGGATNIFSNMCIQILLAVLTYLHFIA
ncbi:chymotrypsin-2-like isoform X1 [Nomia melanderi]|uniref:chymotrypsin-2-like isoform X1 n=1 Tax=Nomia melanderi TaxID=2448451 RepID=UPI003FCEA890